MISDPYSLYKAVEIRQYDILGRGMLVNVFVHISVTLPYRKSSYDIAAS
jgi:hypothetical protein